MACRVVRAAGSVYSRAAACPAAAFSPSASTVDGWEGLLTPDKLEGLTAAGLEALLR